MADAVAATVWVGLQQDSDGYPPWTEEEIEAAPIGGDRYRLLVPPVFARGLSKGDEVHTTAWEGRQFIDGMERESGHSTIHAVLMAKDHRERLREDHDRLIGDLTAAGCEVFHTPLERVFTIDVGPEVRLGRVIAMMEVGASAGRWDFQTACVSSHHEAEPD